MNKKQFGLLLFAVFLTSLDLSIFGPALNTIRTLWGVSERTLSWGVNIYVLMNLVGIPTLSRTSDLVGRRSVLVAALAIFVVGSVVIAEAPDFTWLLFGRAVQGFGAGGITPIVVALIGDTMPKERQGGALGMIGVMLGLGFIVGPVLGGILLHWSWRLLFWINVPTGVALIATMFRALPSGSASRSMRMDWLGLVLLTTSFGCLAVGINRLDIQNVAGSLASTAVWPLFATTAVLLPVFYFAERRAAHPIINPEILRTREIVLTNVMSFGAGLGLISIQFIPRVAKLAFGVHDASASLMLVPAAVCFVVGSFVVGVLLKRVGPRKVLFGCGILLSAGLAMFAGRADDIRFYYLGTIVLAFGLSGVTGPSLRYIINVETNDRDRGAAQALLLNVQIIGQLTGAALIGAFAESWGGGVRGYSLVFLSLAGEAALMVLVTFGLKPQRAAAVAPPVGAVVGE